LLLSRSSNCLSCMSSVYDRVTAVYKGPPAVRPDGDLEELPDVTNSGLL